mmetsp:Transcript_1916/g.3669  ORF Transcript_1916/g.3669 Transcript_1916/m.3669 type:complete len:200 (-) Transcript_1916:125-724(-)
MHYQLGSGWKCLFMGPFSHTRMAQQTQSAGRSTMRYHELTICLALSQCCPECTQIILILAIVSNILIGRFDQHFVHKILLHHGNDVSDQFFFRVGSINSLIHTPMVRILSFLFPRNLLGARGTCKRRSIVPAADAAAVVLGRVIAQADSFVWMIGFELVRHVHGGRRRRVTVVGRFGRGVHGASHRIRRHQGGQRHRDM